MFTQCSNCHTVFELSAEVLRAAGGQVRCGRCGEIFSALARLAEDANSFDNGESAYEMEERADGILEAVVAEHVAQAVPDTTEDEDLNGTEIAQLQVLDFTEDDLIEESTEDSLENELASYPDSEMEYTLPPGELDRIFIESRGGMALVGTAPVGMAPVGMAPVGMAPVSTAPPFPLDYGAAPTPPAFVEDEGPLPDIEVISDNRSSGAVRPPLSPADELRTYDLQQQPTRTAGPLALWLGAAILSALLLAAQVVHQNREALSSQGPLAPLMRLLYSSIGTPLDAAPNLAVFQLRQWGVTGDPAADATLRLRASILNSSASPQPFPLLRVTLANRYGTRIAARDFEPSEYMGKPIARRLSPAETVDVILNILDPGKDAEGFEIDVCLRGADKKIICANDAAPLPAKP